MKTAPKEDKPASTSTQSTFIRNRNKDQEIPQSLSKIKKRIRDVNRTLNKNNHASAQVMIDSKRRLLVLEFELGEKIVDEQERKNASKYHKIKHFERIKSHRKLKQAQKSLSNATDEDQKKKYQDQVREFQIKELYTRAYPKTISYVSLFPTTDKNTPKRISKRERVLNDIEQAFVADNEELTEKGLQLMQKRYREECKEKLIKSGHIQPMTPAPVDEEIAQDEKKDVKTKNKKKDMKKENKDEFFEKA